MIKIEAAQRLQTASADNLTTKFTALMGKPQKRFTGVKSWYIDHGNKPAVCNKLKTDLEAAAVSEGFKKVKNTSDPATKKYKDAEGLVLTFFCGLESGDEVGGAYYMTNVNLEIKKGSLG